MNSHILITGASGLVGSLLIKKLLISGKKVSILSREKSTSTGVNTFLWDVEKKEVDPRCLEHIDCIVHLAGASIGDRRWTEKQKKNILSSRVDSTELLFNLLSTIPNKVKHFIAASAVGFYGDTGNLNLIENLPAGDDFLAQVCLKWENASSKIGTLGISTSILRFGIVLHKTMGSLPVMEKPIKFGLGTALGSGRQWVSWIHNQDLIHLINFLIENPNLHSTYNATAPQPCTNSHLMESIAKQKGRFLWPINVPKFALELILGEMSALVLNSNKASSEKISQAGFEFKYTSIDNALKDIYAH